MNLIRPSFEIWEQKYDFDSIWSHIARCVRVCYQSETRKNPSENDEEFVKRVIFRHEPINSEANHLSVLEHGTIYLQLDTDNTNKNMDIYEWYEANSYSKAKIINNNIYITTNLRVLIENEWLDDLQYICAPTEYHEKRITVCFITNIGVSREFNRHRVNSVSEESTRYCNYHLDKFNNRITFALPSWIDINETEIQACRTAEVESDMYANMKVNMELSDNWNTIDWYLYALSTSALAYKKLIQLGWKPQQAREVLPLATKTQLIHTAFVEDWKHFFALRSKGVSGLPHPNVQLIAKPLEEEFIKRGYI